MSRSFQDTVCSFGQENAINCSSKQALASTQISDLVYMLRVFRPKNFNDLRM